MREDALEKIKQVKSIIDETKVILQAKREELKPFEEHVINKKAEFKLTEQEIKELEHQLKDMKKEFRSELKRLGSELDDFESGKEQD